MTTQEIVSKLWNLCNVLRDDGITYHQYVTELTYILFLKMAKETGAESQIPEGYRWDVLKAKSGVELKKFYKELLNHLGENCTGRVREIYQGSATNIDEPKNLEKIITTIDGLDWFSAREEGLGNLYEGLLEKNANEKKSGAGQYFTPRVLIDVMTRLVKPQPGERCNDGKEMKGYDVVLTNPPFGTKKGGERATRDDFTFPTSNKQLNFLQHIYRSLNTDGKARAAVVLPDNVLFADGDGERIRKDLMEKCNLHTILRLPTGIFYAQGVKTNVLFFTRGKTDKDNTKEVWIYDLRNDMPSFGKTNPLKKEDFDDFVACYADGDLSARKETYSEENPNGRWRKFTYEEILARDKTSLDITWMKSDTGADDYTLAELLEQIKEKSANISKAVNELEVLIGEVEE